MMDSVAPITRWLKHPSPAPSITVHVRRQGEADMEPATRHRRQRALLVDDDTSSLRDYVRELTTAGYDVTKASDAAVALGLARRSVPDVIFLRIGSRGTGSLAFLAELRADDMTRHVPVTMLSSRRNATLEKAALMTVIERERS